MNNNTRDKEPSHFFLQLKPLEEAKSFYFDMNPDVSAIFDNFYDTLPTTMCECYICVRYQPNKDEKYLGCVTHYVQDTEHTVFTYSAETHKYAYDECAKWIERFYY